jgi:hypothetical protein
VARFVIRVAPEFGLPNARLGHVGRLFSACLDDAVADIGPSDVDGDNCVITFEDPRGGEVQRADQAGVVGVMTDRLSIFEVFVLEDDFARAMASSPSRLSRKPPPTTMRSVFSQDLVLRKRRVT